MTLWLTVIGMGLITYAIRLSLIVAFRWTELPDLFRRALSYVPPAVLSAIIFPELLQPGESLDISLNNGRLLSGLLACVIAWRTKNVLLTIAIGMIALWIMQALQHMK